MIFNMIKAYYYQRLCTKEKELYIRIKVAMEKEERYVKLYDISDKKLQEVINYVLLDNSMIYYVDARQFKVTYGVLKSELNLRYLYTPEQRKILDEKLTNRIKLISNRVKSNDDYETVKKLYSYFVSNYTYWDTGGNEEHTILGPFINEEAVCQGFSYGFKCILDYLGVDCIVATGVLNDVPHAWNIVWINQKAYHVDVTAGINLSKGVGMRYDYLCVDDTFLEKTHLRDNNFPVCNDGSMSYYYINDLIANSETELLKLVRNMSEKGKISFAIMVNKSLESLLESELEKVMNAVLLHMDNVREIYYSYQNGILFIRFLRK